MKTGNSIKILIFLAAMLSLPLAANAADDTAQGNTTSQTEQSDQMVIHLGKIEVKGQKQIIEVLQTIKVALKQPYSDDPKLANVVVCRIKNDMGSHANQLLECATNHTLSERRRTTQSAIIVSTSAPTAGGLPAQMDVLHSMLMSLPDNYMQAPVNGSALHALLEKIPNPAPASPATSALAASTHS
ncbi:MAG TPA: hypothetical protein VNF46_02695 [Gammaproteobacteria bacterium]|nr:hypothetical protein [Gammaproteobacteria bacterium]